MALKGPADTGHVAQDQIVHRGILQFAGQAEVGRMRAALGLLKYTQQFDRGPDQVDCLRGGRCRDVGRSPLQLLGELVHADSAEGMWCEPARMIGDQMARGLGVQQGHGSQPPGAGDSEPRDRNEIVPRTLRHLDWVGPRKREQLMDLLAAPCASFGREHACQGMRPCPGQTLLVRLPVVDTDDGGLDHGVFILDVAAVLRGDEARRIAG